MKKLSTLIAILLIATIGGVYATWTYAESGIESKTAMLDAGTKITGTTDDNPAKGVLAVDVSNLAITIDDANNDHIAEITYTGSVMVTFTVNQHASDDIKANGLPIKWSITSNNTTDWEYDGKMIFDVDTTAVTVQANPANKVISEGVITFTYEIAASEIQSKITFFDGEELVLDTKSDYEAFKSSLHKGSLIVNISAVE